MRYLLFAPLVVFAALYTVVAICAVPFVWGLEKLGADFEQGR